jgi:multidrug efflux system membrane fusion protein
MGQAAAVRQLCTRQWLVLLLLALIGISIGCSSAASKPTRSAGANPAVPISATAAKREDLPVYLVGLGSATPLYAVSIKSRVDGQLMQVSYKEGQHVNKGDLLAIIDPRPYEVALSQAQAQLFKDQASLRDAKLNYDRYKALLQQSGAISQQQVDTQQATVDQFEGAVRTDQAAIDNAKLNVTYCHITSPISGRVGLRLVDPGNMVHASDANPLLVITQLQPITVIFTLPEDQLPAVAQHMRAGPLLVDAYSRDDRTKLTTGKLLTIDNEIDQTTGTGRLKAVFDNKNDELWPNQFVNVHLLLNVLKNTTVVPAAAVQHGPQGTFAYVVKPDSTVEVRPVTVQLTQNNLSAISQGLAPGEMVVTDGQDKLQAGTKVETRTTPSPGTNGPGADSPSGGAPGANVPGNNPRHQSAPGNKAAPSSSRPASS